MITEKGREERGKRKWGIYRPRPREKGKKDLRIQYITERRSKKGEPTAILLRG